VLTSFWCSLEQKNIQTTPPVAQLEHRVDDSFPQTTQSPKGEGGAVEVELDMPRVSGGNEVETERFERVRWESEEKEGEREEEESWQPRTAESPVDEKERLTTWLLISNTTTE